MTTADVGREAVYAAEIAAFEGTSYESRSPFDDLVEIADRVSSAMWWPHDPITVVAARADARSSSTRQRSGDAPVIRLAAPQTTPATVVHEIAHVLAGVGEGHGEVFRRAHVDVVAFAFGGDEADWLAAAYVACGLALGHRAWPAPPPAGGAHRPLTGGRAVRHTDRGRTGGVGMR